MLQTAALWTVIASCATTGWFDLRLPPPRRYALNALYTPRLLRPKTDHVLGQPCSGCQTHGEVTVDIYGRPHRGFDLYDEFDYPWRMRPVAAVPPHWPSAPPPRYVVPEVVDPAVGEAAPASEPAPETLPPATVREALP